MVNVHKKRIHLNPKDLGGTRKDGPEVERRYPDDESANYNRKNQIILAKHFHCVCLPNFVKTIVEKI